MSGHQVQRLSVTSVQEIVAAREQGRTLASALGFAAQDCVLVVTAISELGRYLVLQGTRGELSMEPLPAPRRGLRLVASFEGPAIPPDEVEELSAGRFPSDQAHRALSVVFKAMDAFRVTSGSAGTIIFCEKWLGSQGQPPAQRTPGP